MDHYSQIVAQHKELEHTLDLLAVIAAAPSGVLPDCRLRELLAAELRKAHRDLSRHFQFEEQDGYMHEVARARPTLSTKLAGLKEEHSLIRGSLDALRKKLGEKADAADVAADLQQLLRVIRKHEAEENKLCQVALMHDIGSGD